MKILIAFLLYSSMPYSQKNIPMQYERMQEIVGENKIVYVSGWQFDTSILFDDCFNVTGQFADGRKFLVSFDGERDGRNWIANGKAELCIGEECGFTEWGCTRKCNYRYIE